MPEETSVAFSGGKATSSPAPPYHLIPTEGQRRLALRFQLGIDRRPDGSAWNAISGNQEVLTNRDFILNRIGHVIEHACKLRDKIASGGTGLEGDDEAGALAWAGSFLCCATKALADVVPLVNCSACGGIGRIVDLQSITVNRDCPACKGTGKSNIGQTR